MLTEEEFLSVISDYIRKKRLENNISCEKLAEMCDMDYSSVNLIENKKQNPRSYSLYKILANLDMDIATQIKKEEIPKTLQEKIFKKLSSMNEYQLKSLIKLLSLFDIRFR